MATHGSAMGRGGKVSAMRLTKRRVEQLIRQAAKDSSRVVNTLVFREDQLWQELVTSRQIQLCLEEGEVLDDPTINEHGHWVCRVYRMCGGIDVFVVVAISNQGNEHKLYITDVERAL